MNKTQALLRAIDNYLDNPPASGSANYAAYVTDLQELLEACAQELETRPDVPTQVQEETRPDVSIPVTQEPRPDVSSPSPKDVPVSAREQRRINKRNVVHATLVDTEWDCAKTAKLLHMKRDAVWRLVRSYWPDHPPFENAKITKNVLLRVLLDNNWFAPGAAKDLSVPKTTIYRAMQRYNLRRPDGNATREIRTAHDGKETRARPSV